MRLNAALPAFLAGLLLPGFAAAEELLPSECRRFAALETAKPTDFTPRLARLCVRLIDAHEGPDGLDADERDAATRLGSYLAIVGELDLRKGALGVGSAVPSAKGTNETSRYLIADRIGLLEIADRLAPQTETSAALR